VGEIKQIEERITQAERRWPRLLFEKTGNEAHSACPRCGGEDRFCLFEDSGFWCRQCGHSGWLDDDKQRPMTEVELTQIRIRRLEYKQEEHARRLSALEKIHEMMHVADFYYHNLTNKNNNAFEYWLTEGMKIETIDKYKLGYCSRCMTDKERRASYTIPVIIHERLYNIRHRLIGADSGDKYRPQMAGLPTVLFNADNLYGDSDSIIIVEGEKKSIVTAQAGFPNVGLMGKQGFKPEWASKFARFKTVYVALDPDATQQAIEIAGLFNERGRVVILPKKIDDMLTEYNATPDDIRWFIKMGKPV